LSPLYRAANEDSKKLKTEILKVWGGRASHPHLDRRGAFAPALTPPSESLDCALDKGPGAAWLPSELWVVRSQGQQPLVPELPQSLQRQWPWPLCRLGNGNTKGQ
jgi:hypothetical protein